MNDRVALHEKISAKLAGFTNQQLRGVVDAGEPAHSGIGGKSVCIQVQGVPVFVKRVPLTELELRAENRESTANIFQLPLCCQYGIGSPGFGAWRELSAHRMTTEWVLAGDCNSFPILFHWRVLPNPEPRPFNLEEWMNVDECVKFQDSFPSLRTRTEALNFARYEILLFLEFVPQTLYSWLTKQIADGESSARSALNFVEENLNTANTSMRGRGFIHFDAHFENIVTDARHLYLSDFGLAMSSRFDLCATEIEFFNEHKDYDRSMAAIHLVHAVVTALYGKDNWRQKFSDCLTGGHADMPPPCASIIDRYGQIASTMVEFFTELKRSPESARYPAARLEKLWLAANSGSAGL